MVEFENNRPAMVPYNKVRRGSHQMGYKFGFKYHSREKIHAGEAAA